MIDPKKIVFVGMGTSAVCHYRILLPAMAIGADWVGLAGVPPAVKFVTGSVGGKTQMAKLNEDYDVVILQQPKGRGWLNVIKELQAAGTKVVYEIDDYLHGIRKMEGSHDFHKHFSKKDLQQYELCMRACDAMICSTPYIARRYKQFNKNTYCCPNGLDVKRYDFTLPKRQTTNVLWAGGTGHKDAVIPWMGPLARVMNDHPEVCFISVGQPFANGFKRTFGERALAIPFLQLENYSGAMTLGDIHLAPSGKGLFHKGKSQLRLYEASAVGGCVVGDPELYTEIVDGETGFLASSPEQFEDTLRERVQDVDHTHKIGAQAREWVRENRSIEKMAPRWLEVCSEIATIGV